MRRALADHALTELWHRDAQGLPSRGRPSGRVHFGYRRRHRAAADRRRAAAAQAPDLQPEMPTGDLLLGRDYVNSFGGNFAGSLPPALATTPPMARSGSCARTSRAFEGCCASWGQPRRVDPELVAAKLLGRWRNGVPLVARPRTPTSQSPPCASDELNEFDYAPDARAPALYDDSDGLRCPFGAHIRRLNPRGAAGHGHAAQPAPRPPRACPTARSTTPARSRRRRRARARSATSCAATSRRSSSSSSACGSTRTSPPRGLRGTREPIIGASPTAAAVHVRTDDGSRQPIVLHGPADPRHHARQRLLPVPRHRRPALPRLASRPEGGARMITSTKPALADQIRALLAQATEQVVPGRVLAWWGTPTSRRAPRPLRP